jgi:hypothetical protein
MLPKNPSGIDNKIDPITGSSATSMQQQTAQLAQNLRNVNSVFAEFIKDLAIKMEEVVSPSLGIKSGTFEAFGNNFVTRGAMAGMDTVMDATEGIFGNKEALKEKPVIDPIQAAIEKQTQVLMSVFGKNGKDSGGTDERPSSADKNVVPRLDELNKKAQEILDFIKKPKDCSDDCSRHGLEEIGNTLKKLLELGSNQEKHLALPDGTRSQLALPNKSKVLELEAPKKIEEEVLPFKKSLLSLSKMIKVISSEIEKIGSKLKKGGSNLIQGMKDSTERVVNFFSKKKAEIEIPELKPLSESPRKEIVKKFGKKAVPASLAMMAKDNPTDIVDVVPKTEKKKSRFSKITEKISKVFSSNGEKKESKISSMMKAVPASLAMMAMKPSSMPGIKAFDPLEKTPVEEVPPQEKDESSDKDSGIGTLASVAAGALAAPVVKSATKGIGKIGSVLGKGLVKSAKFIPGIGAAIAAGDAAYESYDAVKNSEKIFGTEKATTSQNISAGIGGIAKSLSFGLLDSESTAKKVHGLYQSITGGADINSNGEVTRLEKEIAAKTSAKTENEPSIPVVINNDNSTTRIVPGRKFVENSDHSYQKYLDRTMKTV